MNKKKKKKNKGIYNANVNVNLMAENVIKIICGITINVGVRANTMFAKKVIFGILQRVLVKMANI